MEKQDLLINQYKKIDTVLMPWARENKLTVLTKYRDDDVRSITLNKEQSKRYQIWIEVEREDQFLIHVWNYRNLKSEFKSNIEALKLSLDSALNKIEFWDGMEIG